MYNFSIEKHNQFQYPFMRSRDDEYLQDIHDGDAFVDLMLPGNFLCRNSNTGLVLSTDGVPIFKSSKGSIWPVYLMLTSIPPHQRMRVDNLVVASLWFGPTKPDMTCMLQPILENVSSLEREGVTLQVDASHSEVVIRAKLVMAIFDLPAKAAATNTKQFNGEFGCFYCLNKGKVYNRARIYTPDDSHVLRTPEQMKKWAEEAEINQESKFGVKGFSLLSNYLTFPQCIPVDYMHCVLEGVVKQLLKLWFGSNFHKEAFSLRKHINQIDKILSNIKTLMKSNGVHDHLTTYLCTRHQNIGHGYFFMHYRFFHYFYHCNFLVISHFLCVLCTFYCQIG